MPSMGAPGGVPDASGTPAAPGAASFAQKLAFGFGLFASAALVTFLVAMSGYVFGQQEGMNGPLPAVVGWGAALLISLIAPLAGLLFWRQGRPDRALALVWMPSAALLVGCALALTAGR